MVSSSKTIYLLCSKIFKFKTAFLVGQTAHRMVFTQQICLYRQQFYRSTKKRNEKTWKINCVHTRWQRKKCLLISRTVTSVLESLIKCWRPCVCQVKSIIRLDIMRNYHLIIIIIQKFHIRIGTPSKISKQTNYRKWNLLSVPKMFLRQISFVQVRNSTR